MTSVALQSAIPEALNVSLKPLAAVIVVLMMVSFLAVGILFRVADTDNMWVAGRSIGNIENGMAIGSNWMSAASYLGLAGAVATSGVYGLSFIVGWTTGYFVLLIFMAAQMRRFGKYTAPDFIGDRFNSDAARAIAAVTTFLIGFVYAIGQAKGMGQVGLYVFGDIGVLGLSSYQATMIIFMLMTIGYLALSGMLGATKNMVYQYAILILAFLVGLYAVGWVGGYSTVLPPLEYGPLFDILEQEFYTPFENAGYYLWIATAVSLIFGTCGLPHVLVRFYTVENERTARWSTVWGLFFICILYWGAPAFAAFGTDLYAQTFGSAYGGSNPMSGAEGDVIVVLAAQLAELPSWLIGLVAAGGIAAAVATVSGLFIAGSSAVSHDIYANIINEDATQRQQMIVGRASIVLLGVLTMAAAYNPAAPIAALVAYAFSLAATVLFPMFFLGLWWENTNREGALTGMISGLVLWSIPMVNEVVPTYISGLEAPLVGWLAQAMPAIGSAIVAMPLVFVITIFVSLVTEEPPEKTKQMVRQCHSPQPMAKDMTAEEVVARKTDDTPADD